MSQALNVQCGVVVLCTELDGLRACCEDTNRSCGHRMVSNRSDWRQEKRWYVYVEGDARQALVRVCVRGCKAGMLTPEVHVLMSLLCCHFYLLAYVSKQGRGQ